MHATPPACVRSRGSYPLIPSHHPPIMVVVLGWGAGTAHAIIKHPPFVLPKAQEDVKALPLMAAMHGRHEVVREETLSTASSFSRFWCLCACLHDPWVAAGAGGDALERRGAGNDPSEQHACILQPRPALTSREIGQDPPPTSPPTSPSPIPAACCEPAWRALHCACACMLCGCLFMSSKGHTAGSSKHSESKPVRSPMARCAVLLGAHRMRRPSGGAWWRVRTSPPWRRRKATAARRSVEETWARSGEHVQPCEGSWLARAC